MIHLKDGSTLPLGPTEVGIFQTNAAAAGIVTRLDGGPLGSGGHLHNETIRFPTPGMWAVVGTSAESEYPNSQGAPTVRRTTFDEIVSVDPGSYAEAVSALARGHICADVTYTWDGRQWSAVVRSREGYILQEGNAVGFAALRQVAGVYGPNGGAVSILEA